MSVTVPEVVRALAAVAPEGMEARPWLSTIAQAMDAIDEATGVEGLELGPFATLEDVHAARNMLQVGATGRRIAADFELPIGAVGEWVQRERERQA